MAGDLSLSRCLRLALLGMLCVQEPSGAHETITTKLTWSAEMSRIFEKRCTGCHREGGQAPMPLTTYSEVRPWAVAIREEVLEHRMPPWNAVKGFGDFLNDGGLSQEEIQRIAEWVTGGAPEGDPQLLKPTSAPETNADRVRGTGQTLKAGSVLNRSMRVEGIRPASLAAGASVKVTAHKPDGSIEPLLWILNYRPQWKRTYVYRNEVRLPRGTRIEVHPPEAASFEVIASRPGRSAQVPK